jgi:hypothetical protein
MIELKAMMKNDFVANGKERWLAGQGAKHLEIARAKYTDEWNQAGFLQRIRLRFLIWRESQNPKHTSHRPSPATLW